MKWYIWCSQLKWLEVAVKSWTELNWTHENWIPFRGFKSMSYQAMGSIHTQNQLCTAVPISFLVQCSNFISAFACISRHIYLYQNLAKVIIFVWQNEPRHMVFTTKDFLEGVTSNWPEWDLNIRLLNSVQTP